MVFVLKLVLAYHRFSFYFHFDYSSLHLDLSWKDIGRYKHMNQKSFGQSSVLIDQMKALLISAGRKMQTFWCIHSSCWVLVTAYNLNSLSRRGHLFDYTSAVILYEMCMEEPTATVSFKSVVGHMLKSFFFINHT